MVMIRAVLFDAGHNPKLCYVASAQKAQKAKAKEKEEKKFLAASSFTKRWFDTSNSRKNHSCPCRNATSLNFFLHTKGPAGSIQAEGKEGLALLKTTQLPS